MPFGNSAYGLVVECHEGRPTKIEGNPLHPSTLGSANIMLLASILNLYDPDRSNKVRHNGNDDTYANFVSFWRDKLSEFKNAKGRGLAILAEPFSSPTLMRLHKDFMMQLPEVSWITCEPISDENSYSAIENLTGKKLRTVHDYQKANIILALDSDFLNAESESIIAANGFADGRRLDSKDDEMNRLYVVENAFTITGGMADHRLRLPSSQIGTFLIELVNELRSQGLTIDNIVSLNNINIDKKWLKILASDLLANRGKSIIVIGRNQPVWVHELALIINEALGNIGNTINLKQMPESLTSNIANVQILQQNISDGKIDTLVIIGGNPVYDMPANFDFARRGGLHDIPHTIHLSSHVDETSDCVEWHIPRAHYLESWGDTRDVHGTLSAIQPLIEPLFDGHMDVEFYQLLATGEDLRGYDIVRETWKEIFDNYDFEKRWRKALHDGIAKDGSLANEPIRIERKISDIIIGKNQIANTPSADKLEVAFYPSQLYDGRFANNGWLQELPDGVTRLCWDNAALISPKTAGELNLANTDMIKLELNGNELTLPVWISPGQADYTLAIALGYGRTRAGKVGNGVGFDAYKIRTSDALYTGNDAKITKTGEQYFIANVQEHNSMENRPIIREATLSHYRKHPQFAAEMVEADTSKSMYPDYDYSKGYQWGMVIDLNTCIGCNACVIACQSENNVQIAGKVQVAKGREMHWIRNDRYYNGDIDNPKMVHMPVACQHCENAPCESVCPVAATSHDKEGLNVMTYNRCVGTRYCSNNCPYKVRRFNFFNYVNDMPEVVKMAQNPDVTVRSRGVMEKCTFCIQRINRAKIKSKLEERTVADGEIKTACQQACPTKAIHFGNINDPDSIVTLLKHKDRNYQLLGELNTRPRNSYLAKIRNPHPELETKQTDEIEHS
jgi:molybdopterin-containing oxidoreductase family iron-sulfur binding subunit